MILLFLFGMAWNNRAIQIPENYTQTQDGTSSVFVNETETTFQFKESEIIFGITLTQGILVSVSAIVAFGFAIGIKAFDTGISERAQNILFNFSIYMGLWGIFSIFNYGLIMTIPIFGWFIFLMLTLIHLLGIVQIINRESTLQ